MLIIEKCMTMSLCQKSSDLSQLKKLLASNCKIEKVYPPVFASDAEINIVTVVAKCPDGRTQTIRAYGEEAYALR
jgi:hypothetical protein